MGKMAARQLLSTRLMPLISLTRQWPGFPRFAYATFKVARRDYQISRVFFKKLPNVKCGVWLQMRLDLKRYC